jgi:hypothetical protein
MPAKITLTLLVGRRDKLNNVYYRLYYRKKHRDYYDVTSSYSNEKRIVVLSQLPQPRHHSVISGTDEAAVAQTPVRNKHASFRKTFRLKFKYIKARMHYKNFLRKIMQPLTETVREPSDEMLDDF